jgi:hypothetical protein
VSRVVSKIKLPPFQGRKFSHVQLFCHNEPETKHNGRRERLYLGSRATLQFNIFGKPIVEPKEISTASVRDLCLFIRATGIMNLCC